jgi:peroxiredoxin family protein
VNSGAYRLAAVLASGEPERLYSGLSLLVSAAGEGDRCAALASFGGLRLLLDEELQGHAQQPDATPSLAWGGRDTFVRSLLELRQVALELDTLEIYACSASVETMALTQGAVEERLRGVMSTPRFLRATRGAELIFV